VLIDRDADHVSMVAFLVLIAVIGICVLGAAFGTDSRYDRPGRQF
jgi:hypothetical protein